MSSHEPHEKHEMVPSKGEIIVYQTDDGEIKLECRLEDESLWLSQKMMSELFQVGVNTINYHIKEIYESGELASEATIRKFRIVRQEGARQVGREIDFYNLDMIISVGYRVKSIVATRFRIWATQRLKEYIIKGFAMDDERLKESGGGVYFDELLERIRDIRSSEKVFWRKVLDIYALSIDYDPKTEISLEFFKIIQNKMHWAAHGHTAAEIIFSRADASNPNMGMTNWIGTKIRKNETTIAKNYLSKEELDILNRIVTMYFEFAELQARSRKAMSMRNWVEKLDDFLKISDRDLLTHAGKITHEQAKTKAQLEYEKFHRQRLMQPTEVEKHFVEAEKELKAIESIAKNKSLP